MAAKQLEVTSEKESPLSKWQPDIATKYAYVLAEKNPKRGMVYDENGRPRDEQEYKPYLNVLLTSPIIWDGSIDPFSGKPRAAGSHRIRYYDGCTTLFVDDQPKEKATIDELLISTREVALIMGYVFIMGYDSMLKIYMDWCSYNESSPFRVPTKTPKFKNVDSEKARELEADQLELEDTARDLAKDAPLKKMKVHAKYLGVPLEDAVTGYDLSEKALRTEYRKAAKANPKRFVDSYNNRTIEVANWITDAINAGEILTANNMASWKSGTNITDLMGIKSIELIIQKLVELTLTEEGADFLSQLKSLYS